MKTRCDEETLRMALVGYQQEAEKIRRQIQRIREQLRGKGPTLAPAAKERVSSHKHRISPEGIRRIREAQKRRWAAAKKASAAA